MVVPYVILGLAWVFSNPPGAAPDEMDHLTKAIAAARLEIGAPVALDPATTNLGALRNASIARTVRIPAALDPAGYACMAFVPTQTAACQPAATHASGSVERVTPVGAYPVFWYIPLGWAANLAGTPSGAFYLARLVSLSFCVVLLWLGCWHLIRWLGRPATLGLAVAVTPMSVFATATVSTSGIEISSAVAVSAVVVVATRFPRSLASTSTLATLAVAGSSLVLSRQLGGVSLVLFAIIALCRGGARVVWEQLRRGRWPTIVCCLVLVLAGVGILIWERRYDHPALTGDLFTQAGFADFLSRLFDYVKSGIGSFGYLDTDLPGLLYAVWIVVAVIVVFGALVVGSRADRWTIGLSFLAVLVVAYAVQATVFTPIGAGLQGRHILPIFSVVPLLAGVVLVDYWTRARRSENIWRLMVGPAVAAGLLQIVAVYVNGRRYGVGTSGPVIFLKAANWAPPLGWLTWLVAAAIGGIWITVNGIGSARGGIHVMNEVR